LRVVPHKQYLTTPIANFIANEGLYIEQQITPLMSKSRLLHTKRVTQLALSLAKHHHYKSLKRVYIASMYHDTSKEFNDKTILKLVGSYNHKRFPTIHTLHGLASAKYVNKMFNINDKEILNAIANHVIPSKKPTTLDMLIYCADKLESGRTKDDIKDRLGYIKLAKTNLKLGFDKLYCETQKHYQ
jgi:nicotinate-nucleotide adenylyltransferase